MMRFSLRAAIGDIITMFLLRMRLIRKDLTTLIVLFTSVAVFALLIRSLTIAAEDMSSLPVGITDCDNSSSSRDLVSNLKKVATLRIVESNEKKLHKLLLDEMITSYFVIEKGYEEHLKSGNPKRSITMYYKEDNKSASIIADIVAGEMLYPAGLYKSYNRYSKLPVSSHKLTLAQYSTYMKDLIENSTDFNFAFRMIYRNPQKDHSTIEPLSNTLLYNQFIFGILGILNAFIAMFVLSQTVSEKENGVEIRLKISGFHRIKRDIANLCAILVWEGFLSLIFTGLVVRQLRSGDMLLWLSAYSLLLLNSLVLGSFMLLVTKLIRRMFKYQLICSVLILFSGGLGFYWMLSGFYQGVIESLVKFIPNSWFIQGFTDIIIYGSQGGYWKEGHRILTVMAVVLLILVFTIDTLQEMPIIRKSKMRTGR